ncbi:MAG: hypoxanthine phosphoribosyltransferase [Acidobacteriota bacterium]
MTGVELSGEVLKREEEIRVRVEELGKRITGDYSGHSIAVLAVLRGTFMFVSDLVRRIGTPVRCGFVEIRVSNRSELMTEIAFILPFDVADQDLLLVEDVLDTGITLAYLCQQLRQRRPRSLRICTLLDKPQKRRIDLVPDYSAFEAPDQYVVGYGLDYQGQYQNLPYLAYLSDTHGEGVSE